MDTKLLYVLSYFAIGLIVTFITAMSGPHDKNLDDDKQWAVFNGSIMVTVFWPLCIPLLVADLGAGVGRKLKKK